MRIVLAGESFTKGMGYTENNLPKAFARLGHDVHVVAANLQAYHSHPQYQTIYEPFVGPAVQPCGTEIIDGFTLHRLPHRMLLGYPRIRGLARQLKALRPDIVQTLAAASWIPLEAALARPRFGYRLFTGAHQTLSVMPGSLLKAPRWSRERIRSDIRRAVPGRFVSRFTEKCYAATSDCAEVATRFYGVEPEKVDICPIGVDVDLFRPMSDAASRDERADLRHRLGVEPDEILCVYTGRFTEAKNPLCLAEAIARLQARGEPFRGLFVGGGPQAEMIGMRRGCTVRSFVPHHELPAFYRAAEIGVWPTQESMSLLDAAASGIPVVASDRLVARERVDGNGLTFTENDPADLERALMTLKDAAVRRQLGGVGAQKIADRYSWQAIAQYRLKDYEAVQNRRR